MGLEAATAPESVLAGHSCVRGSSDVDTMKREEGAQEGPEGADRNAATGDGDCRSEGMVTSWRGNKREGDGGRQQFGPLQEVEGWRELDPLLEPERRRGRGSFL